MKIINTLKENKKYFIVSLFVLLFIAILIFAYASSSLTLTATPNSQGNYIHLQWNVPDSTQPYTYMLYMKKPGDTSFQTIPAKSQVKVLNVYPPSAYTVSFSGNWTRVSGYGYNSQYGYESTNHTNNSTSSTSLTVNMPSSGTISFWYMVSSETNYDFIHFYIDGQEKLKNSGNLGWQQVSYSVSAGQHTFTWSYTKDYSVSRYNDTAYIDNVSITGIGTFTFENSESLQIGAQQIPNIKFTNWQGQTYTLPKSASLKMWMEQPNSDDPKGYGKGLISVDAVSITDFNNNPTAYLKNSNGTWKYDVVFEGAWDANNGYTLGKNADYTQQAVDLLKQFIEDGGGYLAGHDTIIGDLVSWSTNTNQLKDYLKLKLRGIDITGINNLGNNEVQVVKKGLLTDYPWKIGDIGSVLTVPVSHTTGQVAYGDVWLKYVTPFNQTYPGPEVNTSDGGTNNFYLTTWNNTAMIQTGHSDGEATPDEQKILANTLFYLAQVTDQTSWDDHMGQDLTPPDKPKITNIQRNGNNINISLIDTDKGTTYSYYVEATGMNNGIKIDSNTVTTTITSGIKGYSVVIDNNPNTVPDNTIDTTSSNFSTTYSGSNFYVHVKTIDNAGNVSDVYTYCYSKPFITATPVPSQNAIQLNWGINDNSQTYSYMVYKKDVNDSEFQTIPVKDHLKVLNVYPYIPILQDWMNNYGQGKISVDSVPIDTFNRNPSIIWNYDVAVFGFADSNNGKDINIQAKNELTNYIESGRGVLFGHDTIRVFALPNFTSLDTFINMQSFDSSSGIPWFNGYMNDGVAGNNRSGHSLVRITKKGLLTNYPWRIGDVGTDLVVPYTHDVYQVANGDIWMKFVDPNDPNMTNNANFYLTTWNNTAMIQTGHSIYPGVPSSQYATEDEQKLIANTIFYLGQVTTDTSWLDHSAQDLTPPDTVSGITASQKDNQINISWNVPKDNGNTYEYYVQATGNSDNLKRISDTVSATITTGIKGYSYVIDQNPDTEPDNTVDTTSNNITVSINKEGKYYLHIKAIDNAGNASQTVTYQFYVQSPITISSNMQTTYAVGQAIKVSITTTGPVYRVTAQMWYSSNEYSSTGITDLVGSNGSWHTRQSSSEGYDTVVIIPKNTPDGTYNITITAYARYPDSTEDTKSIIIPITVKGTIYDYYHSEINN